MNVVVIFDVSSNEREVKLALTNKGYHEKWSSNNQTYNLPKSCMWKPETTIGDAKTDVTNVISELNLGIVLQRLLVLAASPWEGIVGI